MFDKKNGKLWQILMVIGILVVSINIHKNVLTLFIPIYLLSLYYCRFNKKTKIIFILATSASLIIFLLYHFTILEVIPSWYFNTRGEIYYKFLK